MSNSTTDNTFTKDVLESKLPVLVDFWAPWCGPCRQLGPIVDQLATEMEGKLAVYKINIDENPEVPSKYGIRGIPTLMLFKDGKLTDTKVGLLPRNALKHWIEKSV